jgi:hypothetical protein
MRSAEVTDIGLAVLAVVLTSALLIAFVSLHWFRSKAESLRRARVWHGCGGWWVFQQWIDPASLHASVQVFRGLRINIATV